MTPRHADDLGAEVAGQLPAVVRIGTRSSALAMAQAEWAAARLQAAGARTELVTVSTHGDRSQAPIAEIGVGVFTSALRDALRAGDVDVAVHSYKDLPTAQEPDLVIAAVPQRADPRDVLVARDGLTLAGLPRGAVVGTGSPRRAAQLSAMDRGLEVVGVRGNVGTRIGKVTGGELDAVVLARAGLQRLDLLDEATETLEADRMVPAPAQGALAVECRDAGGEPTAEALEHLLMTAVDDPDARACATAERGVLATLEAGCSAPVGALAEVEMRLAEDADGDGRTRVVRRLSLRGVSAGAAGRMLRADAAGDVEDARELGRQVGAELLDLGAAALCGPSDRSMGSA